MTSEVTSMTAKSNGLTLYKRNRKGNLRTQMMGKLIL